MCVGMFATKNIKFVEIAGNRKIFLTVIAGKSAKFLFDSGEILEESAVPTDASKVRLLISTSVPSLSDLLVAVQENKLFVEHIFDY